MSFDDLPKGLDSVLNWFLEWFDVCRSPLRHFNDLVRLGGSDKDKIRKSLHLWLVSFVVGLILQFPLFKVVGIEWGNLGFHSAYFLLFLLSIMSFAIAFHIAMRIYGIQSNLADTLAGYTTIIGCYSPFATLVGYPILLHVLNRLRTAKAQQLPFIQAMIYVLKDQSFGNSWLFASSVPTQVASYLLLTLLAYKMAETYSVPKTKTIAAMGFSVSLYMLPCLGIVALIYFTMYAFIQ